jgi:transcriptional regulator with XRE-family HTH domain
MSKRKSQPLPEHAPLAKAIRERLAEKKLTQVSVAERSGLSYELVNSYALGQGNPSYLNFMRLARGLELLPKDLMGRVEAPQEADSATVASAPPSAPQYPPPSLR